VRDKGRALKWIQFTTVGIDIALKAGAARRVWVTNSGDVSQRVLVGHAMALMLGVMRGFRGSSRSAPNMIMHASSCRSIWSHLMARAW
jgi:lactate dehydrogenase-like 2-hydroxyacid dehydrogenase